MTDKKSRILAKSALFAATIIWGGSFVVLKNAIDALPPFFVLALRGSIASVVLLLIFWRRLRKINPQYLWQSAVMGTILFVAYGFQTQGLVGTTPGKNAFLTSVYCILVPFFYWAFTKIKPDRYNILAAIFCIIGIGFVSLQGDLAETGSLIAMGDLLTLISGIFYALHIISIAGFSRKKDVILLTTLQFVVFSIWAWGSSLIFEVQPQRIGQQEWWGLLYLGVFATAIALLLQSLGQKYTPASQTAIILSLEGLFGVAFSILFFGEEITVRLFIGFSLIFIAVFISETKLSFLSGKGKGVEDSINKSP